LSHRALAPRRTPTPIRGSRAVMGVALLAGLAVLALLLRGVPARRLGRRLDRLAAKAGLARDARPAATRGRRRLGAIGAATVAGGVLGASCYGPVGLVAGATGGLVGARHGATLAGRRRARRLAAQLPEALELMGGALRAGRSVRQALPAGAAVGPPLGPVLERA